METVKRLPPTTDTLRRLYTLSGNQCAFPGCLHPMFNGEGNFVGQICHIEAALTGGERFNELASNEQRRSFQNLMLMCYDHHIETNKTEIYSSEILKKIKENHEGPYADIDKFIRSMQSSILDVTSGFQTSKVLSLKNLYLGVYESDSRDQAEINEDVKAFNDALPYFASLSPDAKRIFAISLSRSKHEISFTGRETENIYFDHDEIQRVTGLDYYRLKSILLEMESCKLICWNELYEDKEYPFIIFKNSEANFWSMINIYCKNKNLDVVDLVENMKFSVFD
ncbi:hypothetical protein PMI18_01509 [Pseudomonas sp. GM102]|uniref:hypothetical protein n=1 Tax=Pseudomonas sp. GM102 TaxID=1144321 RepID=UPI00026FA37D|nr:hypothetical protein [Pseudomonas sp. GM102]EJM03813.1 hypothetical protein PMI18_01509 [Pseudomonas sp. GM102]